MLTLALRVGLVVCLPLLIAVLVTGLLVNILQVATQIQDATVSFVPKLVIAGVTLALLAPWMFHRLASFATEMISRVQHVG
jgi:flagellar biosynthetic protein FliQ